MSGRLRWYHVANVAVLALLAATAGPRALLFLLPVLGTLAVITAVHETGHAVAALAVGHEVSKVQLGVGPTLVGWRGRHFHLVITWFPIGGYTVSHSPDPAGFRWRRVVVVAGGLLTNVAMIGVGLQYLTGTGQSLVVGINALALAENLWPRRIRTPMGDQYTDGRALVKSLRLTDREVAEATSLSYLVEAELAAEAGDVDAASHAVGDGLRAHPESTPLRNWLAVQQVRHGNYREAATNLRTLKAAPAVTPQQVAIYRNNLAWALLMHGDPADLPEALEESAVAFELLPAMSSIMGTRGFALISSGARREGIVLCRKALALHTTKGEKATNAAAIALGWAGEWRLEEAERSLAQARRLDPDCPMLPRAAQAVSDLRDRMAAAAVNPAE